MHKSNMRTGPTVESRNKYREWYEPNREEFNARRRKHYRADFALRLKARQDAAEYRQLIMDSGQTPYEVITRMINGVKVAGYSTNYVSQVIGRTPQMIRLWEKKGWIPKSIFSDKHRYYTKEQISLLNELVQHLSKSRRSGAGLNEILAKIHEYWWFYDGQHIKEAH